MARHPSQRVGGSARADLPLFETSREKSTQFDSSSEFDMGHSHAWRQGDARTTVVNGHSHRVVLGRVQRHPQDRHAHTMLGVRVDELLNRFPDGKLGEFATRGGRQEE